MALDVARIRAVCFDVDGTLSDTDDRWAARAARLLRPLGARRAQRLARRLVMGMETPGNWVYGALDRLHLDDEAARAINFIQRRSKDHPGRFTLVPGVDELLARLHRRLPLAVVSARGERATLAFLDQFDLRRYFAAVATALTCTYTKPFPDPVRWAAQQMGVAPQDCLMVGDTTVDIRAGRAAGAQTVGVLCGFGDENELRRAGADRMLESTAELAAVMGMEARTDGHYYFYSLKTEALREMSQRLLKTENLPRLSADVEAAAYDRKVLQNFIDSEGRIKSLPAQEKKFQVLLRHVARSFEPQRRYSEKEVNQILARYHEDIASLRRGLIEYRIMAREGDGREYWLTGEA